MGTEIAILSLVLLILVRDVVLPLLKGNPLLKILDELRKINASWEANQSKINDLHKWHEPDASGRQPWKDESLSRGISENVGKLFSFINDRIAEVKHSISEIKR